jgi:hypothetical protein
VLAEGAAVIALAIVVIQTASAASGGRARGQSRCRAAPRATNSEGSRWPKPPLRGIVINKALRQWLVCDSHCHARGVDEAIYPAGGPG